MRKAFITLVLLIISADVLPAAAQANSVYDVVAAVNDFRTSNGLPALQVDPILMSVAQAHSDYQASIGTVTHTGAGGTRPKDRAIAAGFGSGATVFISENIAGGLNMSISTAIWQYWQDAAHLQTMLNPAAIFIGAGVGKSGDYVYYTVDTGYYAGASANPNPTTSVENTSEPESTVDIYDPFVIASPSEDGTIIHTVGLGQTLIGIANTYDIELNTLLQQNDLTLDSVIFPGDKLIIRPGYTPTATVPPTTPSPSPSSTATEILTKVTSTPRRTFTPRPSLTVTPSATPVSGSQEQSQVMVAVVGLALIIFVSVVLIGVLKRKN